MVDGAATYIRVANIYVEVPTLGIATAERRAADGAQCVPGPFLLRTTFKYYLYSEFRFSSKYLEDFPRVLQASSVE